MLDEISGQPHTAHTCNPVPLIYVGHRSAEFTEPGALCDISPTLMQVMGIPMPAEMSGKQLLSFVTPDEE